MTCATTTYRLTILTTVLFFTAASRVGWAEQPGSPRLAMRTAAGNYQPVHSPSAAAGYGGNADTGWSASGHTEEANFVGAGSREPCWAWCTLGVMSLAILGLFSFGWSDERLPAEAETVCREKCPAETTSAADDTVAEPAPPAILKADAAKPRAGDPSPSAVMRPSHSVCIGICAGGDVWAVACGA